MLSSEKGRKKIWIEKRTIKGKGWMGLELGGDKSMVGYESK